MLDNGDSFVGSIYFYVLISASGFILALLLMSLDFKRLMKHTNGEQESRKHEDTQDGAFPVDSERSRNPTSWAQVPESLEQYSGDENESTEDPYVKSSFYHR